MEKLSVFNFFLVNSENTNYLHIILNFLDFDFYILDEKSEKNCYDFYNCVYTISIGFGTCISTFKIFQFCSFVFKFNKSNEELDNVE